ncbi:RING-H2 finger protein ATL32 [Rhynchospora pubera]|uniref:RING-H2 finger protein ATL32 n=1 Tax=Rhynchospora pubera TaxID=906938 RepID=A0AAV8CR88_9POAL|nr:RING-H2 finger protein ATL32 [Rhynchospora pubera]
MLNSIIQNSPRPAVRTCCLNGGICVTIFFLTISILSCFFLLFVLAGVVWASIYLCAAAILGSLYINWLRRSPQQRRMIPISIPFVTAREEAGLDSFAIAALPSFQYQRYCTDGSNGTDGNGWVQCAICIGTVQVGEMVRKLPACKHLFHVECIDLWLSSHSTCPMCRSIVVPADATEPLV